jgi:ketosteroid isomerase-like protein
MNLGKILCFILTVVVASAAQAKYDRALDGKTKVWHNSPQRRVQASWSGERDDRGYATGRGTLTWFRAERTWLTGSLLPSIKYVEVSEYKGRMVEGKLEGAVVSVDSRGNTYHAKFADGRKTTDWLAGPIAGSGQKPEQNVAKPEIVEAPAEAPPPAPKLDQHIAQKPAAPAPPPPKEVVINPPAETASPSADSLQSLTMPPSSLRVAALTEPSPHPAMPPVEKVETTSAAPAQESPSSPASASTSIKDEDARTVAALDSEFNAAVKANDADTMDRILADDFVLMHGGRTLSKGDMLKQARDKQAKYEHHEIENGSQKVRVWRDTAVVTETVWVKGAEGGKPIDQKISLTGTYVRTPDGWRYVSGQAVPAGK